MDGAGPWQRFLNLTLPLMRKTIALALVISVTGSILAFDQFYIMTAGGPQNRMISVVYYIFNQSFVSFNLGYGAALSIVLLGILLVVSIAQLWLLRERGGRAMSVAGRPRSAGIAWHLTCLAVAIFFLAPFVITFLASFRRGSEAQQPPLPPWPVHGFSLDAYRALDSFGAGIWQHTLNSALVSISTAVLTVAVSLFAGYGFSRFRFPFRNTLFILVIATMMIPFQSILTPLFILLAKLGLTNSLVGLTLVYVTLQLPFSVFMMRNAFDAVPKEIEEAGRMDGAGDMGLLRHVLFPLVLPGVATVAIFAFLNAWNEFLAALVLLSSNDKYTLPVLMTAVRAGRLGAVNWGAVQAGVAVMTIPCLFVFLALQRYYMRGLMAGAVK